MDIDVDHQVLLSCPSLTTLMTLLTGARPGPRGQFCNGGFKKRRLKCPTMMRAVNISQKLSHRTHKANMDMLEPSKCFFLTAVKTIIGERQIVKDHVSQDYKGIWNK